MEILYVMICLLAHAQSRVILGNEILKNRGYDVLIGHRVAVLTNPTGVFVDDMLHIVDVLALEKSVNLVAIFGPEHGFRGEKQAETGDEIMYVDNSTQLPVFSAYNMNSSEITAVIQAMNITAILIDMQDVGVRLYTFIWTMYDVLRACASPTLMRKVSIIVTDRPNPLGGNLVDGPLLNMSCCSSGYGEYPITHIHGLTIAELALLFNNALHLDSAIIPIPMIGWSRSMVWEDTSLPWIPPSPNLPTAASAYVYGSTVFLEATTISEGRGTTTPFETFGAPFLNAQDVAKTLNSAFHCPTESAAFRAAYFQPTFSKYNGTVVAGAQWIHDSTRCSFGSNPSLPALNAVRDIFLRGTSILVSLRDLSPEGLFQWDGSWFGHPGTELIDQYAGTRTYREMIDKGLTAEEIDAFYETDEQVFRGQRASVLLY